MVFYGHDGVERRVCAPVGCALGKGVGVEEEEEKGREEVRGKREGEGV